jgi:hypothetical protein
LRHSRQWVFCSVTYNPSTSLRSLCSIPVTGLPRCYGRSDSCSVGSSVPYRQHENRLCSEQVSLLHAPELPIPPSPTTYHPSDIAFARYPSACRTSRYLGSGLHLSLAGSPVWSAESSSLSYGWIVRLLLLPTPPHDDAVTVGYRPENVCLKGTCTPLFSTYNIVCACRRTSAQACLRLCSEACKTKAAARRLSQNRSMERAFSPYPFYCFIPGAPPRAGMRPRLRRSNGCEVIHLKAPKARAISAWGNAPGNNRNRE